MNNKKKVLINRPLTIIWVGPIYQRLVKIKMQLELKIWMKYLVFIVKYRILKVIHAHLNA